MNEEKKIELSLRTRSAPMTVNEKDRTVDVTFATETPVMDRDWNISPRQDGYFNEILSCDPKHIRMERMQSGAPVLDTHNKWSLSAILGVVERCDVSNNRCDATIRFSDRAEVEPIYQDVKSGIIRNISCGYRVYAYQQEGVDANGIPNMRAIDWEPAEISFVPVQADPKSGVRSESESKYQSIIILNQRNMDEPVKTVDPVTEPVKQVEPVQPDLNKERSLAATAERQRVQDITLAVRTAKLDPTFADKLIADGVSIDKARALVIDEFAKADPHKPAPPSQVAYVGDEKLQVRSAMTDAILLRSNPDSIAPDKISDKAREFRHFSLIDLSRECLEMSGVKVRGMRTSELAERALTTTDFPYILQDAINKTLTKRYEALPATWKLIARFWPAADFKKIHAVKFDSGMILDEIPEHGEYKTAKFTDDEETWSLKTWGKIIPITRKTIINDDLNAFSRAAEAIANAVSRKENAIMWGLVTGNPVMNDTKRLFSTEHKNGVLTSGGAISIDTLTAAKTKIRRQTGLEGQPINVTPKYIIVPPELETLASQYTSQNFVAYESGKINPFANFLTPIVEPLLTDQYGWYMGADPAMIDMLAYSTLDGQTGPYVEQKIGFDVDGIQIKVRHDFNGGLVDYRGFYWNCGH